MLELHVAFEPAVTSSHGVDVVANSMSSCLREVQEAGYLRGNLWFSVEGCNLGRLLLDDEQTQSHRLSFSKQGINCN